jgi:prepilin-type processing-associated H-X9-DG protein
MSNLKQMGVGVMMYVQDADERYPFSFQTKSLMGEPWASMASGLDFTSSSTIFWPHFINTYTKSMALFYCPSGRSKGNGIYGHYGVNRLVLADGSATGKSVALSAVPSPAAVYLGMDAGLYRLNTSDVKAPGVGANYLPGTGPGSAVNLPAIPWGTSSIIDVDKDYKSGRHFDGVNVMFADGHVKWLKSQVVYQEAVKCTSGTCSNTKSGWSPLVDNS